jgi:hypothetical protein
MSSLVYRLKTGVQYKDVPRSEEYTAKNIYLPLAQTVERSGCAGRDLAHVAQSA